MKQFIILLIFVSSFSACNNSSKTKAENVKHFKPNKEKLLGNHKTWYEYTFFNINFALPFVGLDVDSNRLSKKEFLNKISTENFCAFKVMEQGEMPVYKLYPLDNHDDIRPTAKQLADIELECMKLEEKGLAGFKLTDMAGRTYTNANTKGKFLLLKCWFIGCVACVKEFPQLNKLVDGYKEREDILFISLASDPKRKLVDFLQKKPLKYTTVPSAEDFMHNNLGINIFPTHILVDRSGKIVKVTHSLEDLFLYIEETLGKAGIPAVL